MASRKCERCGCIQAKVSGRWTPDTPAPDGIGPHRHLFRPTTPEASPTLNERITLKPTLITAARAELAKALEQFNAASSPAQYEAADRRVNLACQALLSAQAHEAPLSALEVELDEEAELLALATTETTTPEAPTTDEAPGFSDEYRTSHVRFCEALDKALTEAPTPDGFGPEDEADEADEARGLGLVAPTTPEASPRVRELEEGIRRYLGGEGYSDDLMALLDDSSTTDEASPTLALSVAFGSSEAPTEHGWNVSWYDPTSGSWYDFDSCNTAEGLPSIVARLESVSLPDPCPRYRVTFEASWEVEA